jgi:hypothetical protein
VTTEDGGEVTFVGGKAVEQTTGGETPDGDHGDELAAAKAAVKKALEEDLKAEGKKAAKDAKEAREKDPLVPRDRGPDGKFLPSDSVEKEKAEATKKLEAETGSEEDRDASALRKALQQRRDGAKQKAEAAAHLEKERNEARQIYAQLQRERAALEAERKKFEMFRTDPVRAIRENGWQKPEEFILDVAQEGTPEGQARRAQREMQQQLQEIREWREQQAKDAQARQQEAEQAQRRQYRQNVEREFLGEAGKHESLVGMYKGHEVELIAAADVVAEQYRNVTGKEATFAEIAEYLAERTERWYKTRSQASSMPAAAAQQTAAVTQGRPTQGSATGKRSLSPAGSSERRSLGNSYADLDGDERREAAMVAVRSAIHASSGG